MDAADRAQLLDELQVANAIRDPWPLDEGPVRCLVCGAEVDRVTWCPGCGCPVCEDCEADGHGCSEGSTGGAGLA